MIYLETSNPLGFTPKEKSDYQKSSLYHNYRSCPAIGYVAPLSIFLASCSKEK